MIAERILAIDFGTKRVGFALSDPMGILAKPLECMEKKAHQDLEKFQEVLIQKIQEYTEEYNVHAFILGLPKNMDGSVGPMAEKVKNFGKLLKEELKREVKYWDERLTSQFAEKEMIRGGLSRKKRKKKIDSMAAQVLLQSYLDFQKNKELEDS